MSAGISSRQGPHHVAQKFTSTTFPAKAFNAIGLPWVPTSEREGIGRGLSENSSVMPRPEVADRTASPAVVSLEWAVSTNRRVRTMPKIAVTATTLNTIAMVRFMTSVLTRSCERSRASHEVRDEEFHHAGKGDGAVLFVRSHLDIVRLAGGIEGLHQPEGIRRVHVVVRGPVIDEQPSPKIPGVGHGAAGIVPRRILL